MGIQRKKRMTKNRQERDRSHGKMFTLNAFMIPDFVDWKND